MTEPSIPTEKTAKCGNPEMAKTAGLRADCRVPNRNYLSEKKNVANFPKMLGKGATFPRSAVTLPNPPWPQLHGFKAPERLLHFSDRSQKMEPPSGLEPETC